MERIYINTTQSICPDCGKLVNSKIFSKENKVYIEKHCFDHGFNTALISSDYEYYKNSHKYIKPGQLEQKYFSSKVKGCPEDCGICEDHEQHICTPIIEITGSCNLDCPICIAHEPGRGDISFDDLKRMIERLLEAEETIDVLNLSGGEPTIHPEYIKIIEYLSKIDEITTISVSTNGLSFIDNDEFVLFHKERSIIPSLQLDGVDDSVYRELRGQDLFNKKQQVIEKFTEHDINLTLIATIAQGINNDEKNAGFLYDLLMKNENILSLMFQPLVYNRKLGYNNLDRVTIPDIISLAVEAGAGSIEKDDFIPLPCSNANCFSLIHFLKTDADNYIPFKRFIRQDRYINLIKNKSLFGTDEESFNEITDLIFELWADTDDMPPFMIENSKKALKGVKSIIKEVQKNRDEKISPKKIFSAAGRKVKSIYIHHFMDIDTFDITRVRRCCTVYPKTDGKFYPLCSFNNFYRGSL